MSTRFDIDQRYSAIITADVLLESDDFLKELYKFIKDMKLDKSAYLREILKKGFEEDKCERLLLRYQEGEL